MGYSVSDDFYNAADDLLTRNLDAGRADRIAFIDSNGATSYGALNCQVNRFSNLLVQHDIRLEERIMLCLLDTVEWPVCFLGAIRTGCVPIPVNTRLTAADYAFMLADSRARMLVVSEALLDHFLPHIEDHPGLETVIVVGGQGQGYPLFSDLISVQSDRFDTAPTRKGDMCFWLYTSGTTGKPKGAVHLQTHLIETANLYALPVLEISEQDICFSAAKLFFAYGLGNGLTFPMSVGATTVLLEGPPDPQSVCTVLREQRPTIFFGVPTLYAMLLASGELPSAEAHSMRLAVSAGEALPADLLQRFRQVTGVDILDGLGSTEMLHIFLSNRIDDITPGASGRPVPGYDLRLVDDEGNILSGADEMGMLEVSGPTAALLYWNQRDKSLQTFQGPWTRTGDKYVCDAQGVYSHAGRSDDMMKVGGIYVSPVEVESVILKHSAVLEVAVVGHPDEDGLIKPKAYIVLQDGILPEQSLAQDIQDQVRLELAAYKYPRWIEFIHALPKTATGKIQRFKLRMEGV